MSLLVLVALVGTAAARRAPPPSAPSQVRHDTSFAAMPGSKLLIRAVEYDGSTNGALHVQIKNPTKAALTFAATGLYFVPDGNPDAAPQRLGAVGPLQLDAKALTALTVQPGTMVEVVLDVFCIDSHRASPSPANVFTVGKRKLPKALAETIETRASRAVLAAERDGAPAPRPAAKAQIQSEVWRARDASWVKLEGEGTQEAAK